ncbi:MAG: bifunctional histidine phosphatase family protein/GNAT family N-acetyltransferase [Clostridiales bacterium]|nr:bifunctional histidine phosphatase family protein/GNAT family N-acetyltransferase [Clostridiales bacterium]
MTRIYIIRHAEAEGNLYRRIQGQYNSAVTQRGRRQIAALRQRFAKTPVDAVFTSPLYRAMETGRAVSDQQGVPLYRDRGLIEINMGQWEDMPFGEAMELAPETMRRFRSADPAYQPPRWGEDYQQLQARQIAAYLRLAKEQEGKTIACVSHSMAIRIFLCWCHGWPLERLKDVPRSDNTGVSLVELEGGAPRILWEADACHLPGELSTLGKQTWWKGSRGISEANLWFRNWDPVGERQLYLQFRQDAWRQIHGTAPFDGEGFYRVALAAAQYDPRSVRVAMHGKRIVGMLQLDLERDAAKRVGFVPFCYLCPPYRGNGLGVQLLGEAVSVCRPLGRERLRLRCSPVNEYGKRFYRANGFYYIGPAKDSRVPLDLLEKRISFTG